MIKYLPDGAVDDFETSLGWKFQESKPVRCGQTDIQK